MQTTFKEIAAVVFGALLIFFADMVIVGISFGLLLWSGNLQPDSSGAATVFGVMGIIGTALASILGGYVVASITKDKVHATATGFLIVFVSLAFTLAMSYIIMQTNDNGSIQVNGSFTHWPRFILTSIIQIALCTAGGYLWERQRAQT